MRKKNVITYTSSPTCAVTRLTFSQTVYISPQGYRERTELQSASREPVIVEPEIHGGIEIDSNARFLILMSDGLYNALAEATGTSTPNAGTKIFSNKIFGCSFSTSLLSAKKGISHNEIEILIVTSWSFPQTSQLVSPRSSPTN